MFRRWLLSIVMALVLFLGGLAVAHPASANTNYLNGDVCDYYGGWCFVYACTSGVMISDNVTWQEIYHGYASNPSSSTFYPSGGGCYYSSIYVDTQTNIIQVVVSCNPNCYSVWVTPYY